MEEQDKLDDFFQNRLQQNGGSDDDWDRPSGKVWEAAHGQFPTHPAPQKWNVFWLSAIALAVLFAGLGTYTYVLHQEVKQLETKLKQSPIAQAQTPSIDTKKEALITELQTQNAQLTLELNTLNQSNKTLNHKIKTLQSQLSNRSNLPANFVAPKSYVPAPTINNQLVIRSLINLNVTPTLPKTAMSKPNQSLALLDTPIETVRSLQINMPDAAVPIIDKKTRKRYKERKWEVGHTFGGYSKIIPLETNFDKETFFEDNPQVIIAQGFTNGLQVSYKLKNNLFLRSGMKLSIFAYKAPTNVSWVYDKGNEIIDDEGNTVNQFVVNSNSDFNNVENQFNVTIPQDMPLDDGDIVQAEIFNIQTQRTFQLPIGLNYYLGEKRLKAMLSGGLSLNIIRLGDHQIGATFQHLGQDLEVEDIQLLDQRLFNTKQIGGHLGFGLDYQLGRRWHFRSGLVFEGNLFTLNSLEPSTSKLQNAMESQLEFGLFCRF